MLCLWQPFSGDTFPKDLSGFLNLMFSAHAWLSCPDWHLTLDWERRARESFRRFNFKSLCPSLNDMFALRSTHGGRTFAEKAHCLSGGRENWLHTFLSVLPRLPSNRCTHQRQPHRHVNMLTLFLPLVGSVLAGSCFADLVDWYGH